MTDLAELDTAVNGEVVLPGTPRYESVRKPAFARYHDARPRAVVLAETADDVAATLGFARRTGVRVVPRSGGHCFAGRSSTDGIVIDVRPMRAVSVSAGGVATVGAGARLPELYDALRHHGRTLPAGCGTTVGIAGLTLGGGLGLLGRRYGLTCDRLLTARIVLADGRVVECDENTEPELFWALRGAGGGQFGVVTSLVFDTVPEPAVTLFELIWPDGAAGSLIAGWQDWAPDAPDELTAALRITAAGELPPAVTVSGVMLGDVAATKGMLSVLAEASDTGPATASYRHLPYRDVKQALAGDEPELLFSRTEFFGRSLPSGAISDLLCTLTEDRVPGQTRELAFTSMGGAYNRVRAGATAFVHRGERFLLEHLLVLEGGTPAAAGRQWLTRSWDAAHAHSSGRVYPNFPDPELAEWAEAYHGGNYERLVRVKRAYDPDGLFSFPQSL